MGRLDPGIPVVADRGYFSGTEILKCHEAGMTTIIPKTVTSSNRKKGQFDKRDFIYIKKDDEYECPAGGRLIWRFRTHERGLDIDKYWSSACTKCRIKSQCTDGVYRRVAGWVYENLLDDMQDRLDKEPELMRVRRQTVEHPFGTIKSWMGATHFLTKTKKHVNTEMALHVLAYNMKRLITIRFCRKQHFRRTKKPIFLGRIFRKSRVCDSAINRHANQLSGWG